VARILNPAAGGAPGRIRNGIGARFALAIFAAVLTMAAALAVETFALAPSRRVDAIPLAVPLLAGLLVGLAAGAWVIRSLTQPLASMAAAAQRIARGELAVRADPGRASGEAAALVRHFNAMADAIETFERERKATTAGISHELRTPLTILCAQLHAVCDGVVAADPPQWRELLAQAEHLSRLVDDLHVLSMADAGRLPLKSAPLDLATLARDTLQRHAMRLAEHGIETALSLPPAPVRIEGDADRLLQVLGNLIENAVRHGAAGRWIGIAVAREGAEAVVAIDDAGGGDVQALRRHLQHRFGDPARPHAPPGGGSGLGLSIVQSLVAAHGGRIEVGASARGGVQVVVRLPALAEPADGSAGTRG
jgi:signal transduction histidine kinase